jgi:hypothetical protein
MTTGIAAIDDAIARVAEADKEAEASRVAFVLGPEVFAAHMQKKFDAAKKRLEEAYALGSDSGIIPAP